MILTKIPNFIHRIIKNSEDDFYQVVNGCKDCGYQGNLHRHASYYRNVICKEITVKVKIQRVICPDCGKTHALIPSELIPYFQHTLETIIKLLELIISKKTSYSSLIEMYQAFNPSFHLGHIHLYLTRFNTNRSRIEYYCRVFEEIYMSPSSDIYEIIDIFKKFNLEKFNHKYFHKMDKYFMSKVTA